MADPTMTILKSCLLYTSVQPYESRVLVFSAGNPPTRARSKATTSMAHNREDVLDLGTDWKVTFSGLARTLHLDKLHSWVDEEDTRFYSGTAVYERNLSVSEKMLNPKVSVYRCV